MADYINIFGQKIQYLSSDPDPVQSGQVWYNSSSNKLKYRGVSSVGSWATGGNLNTARARLGGCGTQTSALAFGGLPSPSAVEAYNGSSWSTVSASLNSGRYDMGAAGASNTSALAFGGNPTTGNTELYNGSVWTEKSNLNTSRTELSGTGVVNSALAFGGNPNRTNSESWNGSSWTNTPSLNTGRRDLAGAGVNNTSALAFGGETSSSTSVTNSESYNGSTWTNTPSLNTARNALEGTGTQASALAMAGVQPPTTGKTELWNGSSWSEVADLSTGRQHLGGAGTTVSGLAIGGEPTTAATEEWIGPGSPSTNEVATS